MEIEPQGPRQPPRSDQSDTSGCRGVPQGGIFHQVPLARRVGEPGCNDGTFRIEGPNRGVWFGLDINGNEGTGRGLMRRRRLRYLHTLLGMDSKVAVVSSSSSSGVTNQTRSSRRTEGVMDRKPPSSRRGRGVPPSLRNGSRGCECVWTGWRERGSLSVREGSQGAVCRGRHRGLGTPTQEGGAAAAQAKAIANANAKRPSKGSPCGHTGP